MNKAEEFEAIVQDGPASFTDREIARFTVENRELIARALRQEDAIRAALAQQGHQKSGRILLQIKRILDHKCHIS